MAQLIKTREELLKEPYLKVIEIQRLYGLSYREASKCFKNAKKIDDEELGIWKVTDTKVRSKSVLKILGFTQKQLEEIVLGIKKMSALRQMEVC